MGGIECVGMQHLLHSDPLFAEQRGHEVHDNDDILDGHCLKFRWRDLNSTRSWSKDERRTPPYVGPTRSADSVIRSVGPQTLSFGR
ncbi:hypothetical protein GCM10009691_32500 [Brevibacterium picturae]|uniref:Uncharacterized protein n=1 Tax=Brevibacterium picturae TaxID=260553 RepID=A0ABP4N4Z5_9MICO